MNYWAEMLSRAALIVCHPTDTVSQKLLGLTVGERLLLALEKGGVGRVAFAGEGPRPVSERAGLTVVEPGEAQEDVEERYLLPADLVFDPALISSETLPAGLPIRKVSAAEWEAAVRDPAAWLESLGTGRAASGRDFAIRVTDRAAFRRAEQALMQSLKKAADGIVSRYLNRRISTFISKRLARTPVRPNHITAVVFLVGVLSGPFAFLGTPLGFALGGLCYWLSAVLDGCDGEISRLKYQGSPLGAWLDTVVDDLACLSFISGMYPALSRNAGHPYWLYLGGVAVLFFLLTILPRYIVMARYGSGDFQKLAKATRPENPGALSALVLGLRDIVFRTDFLPFAGMVTAVIGHPEIFALPFALGTLASAVDSLLTLAKVKAR